MSSFIKLVVLVTAGVLIAGAAYSEPDTIHARTIGQHGYMDADWYACPSWEVYKKFDNLLKKQPVADAQAAFVLADRDCMKVRDQTEVVVEDTNYFWGPSAICVRPIGQPDCGWITPGFVTITLCTPTYISQEERMTCVTRTDRDNPQRPWSAGYSGSLAHRQAPQ